MKKILTIAGSDSGGCAGIQADIKSISANGGFATSVIVAVTSQNTLGVTYYEELSIKSIETQIDAVLEDIGADAIKTGMLASKEIITTVAKHIARYGCKYYLLDPVMVSTSGASLLKSDAVDTLIKSLIPLSYIITPNIPEAELLTGLKITSQKDIDKACKYIFKMGAKNVLIKGGHGTTDNAIDTLYDGANFSEYNSERIDTKNTHGTGCTFASAIATYLAKEDDLHSAISKAKSYITTALRYGKDLGIGSGSGPVNHFYNII